jgi:hypothetical protein
MIRTDCMHGFVCEQSLELPVSLARSWPCCRKVEQTTAIQTKQFPAAVSYEMSRRMGLAIRPPAPPTVALVVVACARVGGMFEAGRLP